MASRSKLSPTQQRRIAHIAYCETETIWPIGIEMMTAMCDWVDTAVTSWIGMERRRSLSPLNDGSNLELYTKMNWQPMEVT